MWIKGFALGLTLNRGERQLGNRRLSWIVEPSIQNGGHKWRLFSRFLSIFYINLVACLFFPCNLQLTLFKIKLTGKKLLRFA